MQLNTSFQIPLSSGGTPRVGRMSDLSRRVKSYCRKHYRTMYANDFSVLNPTIWANEAILQLQPNMVLGNLVNRDFDSRVARFGDIVNAYVPGTFVMTKKGALCDNVVVQDASGSAIQVALDQFPQVAFLICDGEEDRSALDLVDTLLVPAVIAFAQGIDRILSCQVHQFNDQASGHLNGLDSTTIKSYILDAREEMNRLNVPLAGRSMIVGPSTETSALNLDTLVTAQNVGDNGTALATAILGEKYGFQFVMSQTQPEVSVGQTLVSTTVTAARPVGATTLTLTSATGWAAGMWFTIAGDDLPHQVTVLSSANVTFAPGLKRATAATAAISTIVSMTVNKSGGYIGTTLHPRVIGWNKDIIVTGTQATPQLGQMVTFGVDPTRYAITSVTIITPGTDYSFQLDRPLVNAVANSATVNFGPSGKYNFGMIRNAFTLVNRPVAAPRAGTGALAKTVSDPVNKLSIRVTITYDPYKQGHLVVLDTLMGVGVLNRAFGILMAA